MSQITILKIAGMTCGHCKAAVEKALKATPGVIDAKVDLEKQEAVVTGSASREVLVQAVEDLEFTVVQ